MPAAMRSHLYAISLLAAAMTLAACDKQTAGLGADPIATGSTVSAGAPSFKRTQELSKQWEADRSNVEIGLAYADSLDKLGQTESKLQVLRALSASHPENGDVQAKLGKQFLSSGQAADAVAALEKAVATPGASPQTYSALGSAYDQQGRWDLARRNYNTALQIKPGDVSVTNNLAMSFALEGKLPQAEQLLRQALSQPGAKDVPRIRQNLALVIGLQGRFDEARKIASEDLPPDQVDANLAYLQQMLSQPNTWQQLAEQDGQPG